jgi:hypothetical protein
VTVKLDEGGNTNSARRSTNRSLEVLPVNLKPDFSDGRKMMTRIARCSCGALRAETMGEPALVLACHCRECHRRTGAAFGVSVYFEKAHIRTNGASKVYSRNGQEGRKVRFHFCPECGATVYWDLDNRPDLIGVAFGAFDDPSLPSPTVSIWEESRHLWVEFGHDLGHFPQQPSFARPAS